jgi:hypothetical protein
VDLLLTLEKKPELRALDLAWNSLGRCVIV